MHIQRDGFVLNVWICIICCRGVGCSAEYPNHSGKDPGRVPEERQVLRVGMER